MKNTNKKLSYEIKENAKIMLAEGRSYNIISKTLNISKGSINKISKEIDNLEQLRTNKKEEIIKTLWEKVRVALSHIDIKKLKNSSAYQLMTIAAIGVDKAQLLGGEATGIVEIKTEKELDRELKELQVAERELQEAWARAEKKRVEVEKVSSEKDEKLS